MPGKVIGMQYNYGYPGQLCRQGDEVSRTRPVKSSSANIGFGDPAMLNTDGSVSKGDATLTAANFAGVAMRRVKSATVYPQQNNGFYAPQEPCDILERGAICVQVNVGNPTVGGDVYVRITANAGVPTGVVGGFEAAADGANTVKLTNAKFGTTKDANGVAELVILTRQGV